MLTKIDLRVPGDSPATTMAVGIPTAATRYFVTNVEGLGPVKSDVSTSSLALLDGVALDHARTGVRNIVIDFEYRPNHAAGESVYSLRQALYAVAGPKRMVELTFTIEGVGTRKIEGIVESVESEMFAKELTAQMSVLCPVPYFVGAEVEHTFTPATNNTITYQGDVPAGVMMGGTLAVVGQNMRFRRNHVATGWQELRVSGTIPAGQGLMFNTIDREKYAKLFAGTNLIPRLTTFDWWKLYPGKNTVNLIGTTTSGAYPAQGTYNISYKVLYGGL